jgi:hypothetical protein
MAPFGRNPRPEPDRPSGQAPNGLDWESVWDYPRPPETRPEIREVTIAVDGVEIARCDRAVKVCETAGGPVVYLPPEDHDPDGPRKDLMRSAGRAGRRGTVARRVQDLSSARSFQERP